MATCVRWRTNGDAGRVDRVLSGRPSAVSTVSSGHQAWLEASARAHAAQLRS